MLYLLVKVINENGKESEYTIIKFFKWQFDESCIILYSVLSVLLFGEIKINYFYELTGSFYSGVFSIFRHYMQGPALENRLKSALESAFEEMDKHLDGQPFDCAEHVNYIVGNLLTGLCFGGK